MTGVASVPGADDRRPVHRGLVLLDPVKVRNARLHQGWAEHTLSGALAVAPAVVRRIEHGHDQRFLTLAFVRDLARLLGTTIHDLLVDPADDGHRQDPDTIDPDDAATVGAVLAAFPTAISIDRLAAALGWTLERTLLALDRLDGLLVPAGQRLAWHHDSRVQLAPHAVADEIAAAVSGPSIAEDGLDLLEARLIGKIILGAAKTEHYGPSSTFAATRLTAGGLIDSSVTAKRTGNVRGAESARLTQLARYNLVLDD